MNPLSLIWKRQLDRIEETIHQSHQIIMSAITDFAAEVITYLDGIKGDIARLKAKIEELETAAGNLSPEDLAKLEEIKAIIKEIDEQTDKPPQPTQLPA